jgi:hypothetical protein
MEHGISREQVLEVVTFCRDEGIFVWKERDTRIVGGAAWNKRCAGKRAGSRHNCGYRSIVIRNAKYLEHRLVWLCVYGDWPDTVDHINGVRDDNRVENLRSVSKAENARNCALSKKNTSGVLGISFVSKIGKWEAHIRVGGKKRRLGQFINKEDAIAARGLANRKYGFHPNHGRAA